MLCAQYGWDFAKSGEAAADVFLQLIDVPRWDPSEIYVPPHGTALKERPYVIGANFRAEGGSQALESMI